MINKTVLDKLVNRLNQIARDIAQSSEHQDALEHEVADVGVLLSGLEMITGLLIDTFNDIDATLLGLRMDQEKHRRQLQDSLASISTILTNYPEVFVRLDVATVKMFLENVDRKTLKAALVDMDIEIINGWYMALSNTLRDGDEDESVWEETT